MISLNLIISLKASPNVVFQSNFKGAPFNLKTLLKWLPRPHILWFSAVSKTFSSYSIYFCILPSSLIAFLLSDSDVNHTPWFESLTPSKLTSEHRARRKSSTQTDVGLPQLNTFNWISSKNLSIYTLLCLGNSWRNLAMGPLWVSTRNTGWCSNP